MKIARIKADGGGYYHCLSRVVDRKFRFGPLEKERFHDMMRRAEEFSGVKVLV